MTSNCPFPGDLQEPFRWIADVAVMESFESGVLDLPDFYFTGDDYRFRFEYQAKQRFLDLIRERFNSGVAYKGRAFKSDTVIEQKTVELGRYLAGRTGGLEFSEPSPNLGTEDCKYVRKRILGLSRKDTPRLGIRKSRLYHLRKNTRARHRYKVYRNA